MGQIYYIVYLTLFITNVIFRKVVLYAFLIFSFSGRLNYFRIVCLFVENSFRDEVIKGNLSI